MTKKEERTYEVSLKRQVFEVFMDENGDLCIEYGERLGAKELYAVLGILRCEVATLIEVLMRHADLEEEG